MKTKIAKRCKFDQGAPRIQAPGIYGAGPGHPILYRIPVLGQRPMEFTANLPDGLEIDCEGIIRGSAAEGTYLVKITAQNTLDCDEKIIRFVIAPRGVCQTPLMGWTSWNAP